MKTYSKLPAEQRWNLLLRFLNERDASWRRAEQTPAPPERSGR